MRAARLASVTLSVLLALSLSSPAMSQPSPTSTPSPSETSPADQEPPPWEIGGRLRFAITGWFADLLTAAVEPTFDLLGRTIFSTPRVDEHTRVGTLWNFSVIVADAALVIFVLAGSGVAIAGDEVTSRITLKEMLPRLLVAAASIHLSLFGIGYLISLSNSLAQGFLGAAVDPSDISRQLIERLFSMNRNVFLALLALVIAVLAILVIVAYVIRVAALVILAAAAPLFLATYSLSQSDGWARAWWRALLALLAAPVAQTVVLVATFRVFLTGDLLGLPSSSGLIDLLVIGCLLYLLFKIPFWALNTALSGAGSRAWGAARQQARALAKVVAA